MKSIILIGAGGHCHSVIDIVQRNNSFTISGLVGSKEEIGKNISDFKVIGSDKDLIKLRETYQNAFIAIGQIGASNKRRNIAEKLKELGFKCPNIISDKAIVSDYSDIGNGSFIGHGAIINYGASIGNHCIINSRSLIEHDATIESFCHISTGAIVNGNSKIGYGSFIGSGSIIREGLSIPPNTTIGAGKCVMGWPLIE